MMVKITPIEDCGIYSPLPQGPRGPTITEIRADEECNALFLMPDLIWYPEEGFADLNIENGDLQHRQALHSAICICLFTDRRLPNDQKPFDESDDRRGWAGDGFDIDKRKGERALGSLLWTLWRRHLSYEIGKLAEFYALESLQTLIQQGVAARIDVKARTYPSEGRLELMVDVYALDGRIIYDHIFERQWKQTVESEYMRRIDQSGAIAIPKFEDPPRLMR